ncbi:MAG: ribosome maturation factor RimM [Nitrospirota bacterium]
MIIEPNASEGVTIGIVTTAVGLQGEIKCSFLTDFPDRFHRLSHVTIRTKTGETALYRIKRVRLAHWFVYLFLDGVHSREQADALRGGAVQISDQERLPLPPDQYYRDQIIGLDVFTEVGASLGKVDSVLETGGNDLYVVKAGSREYLIPALKSVVKKVDLLKKEMIITPMEGLLDL